MLTSSKINEERNSNYSLNVIISLGTITSFYFVTILLYILKVNLAKTAMSEWGWSRNGSHKWSTNPNLHSCFSWSVFKKKYLSDKRRQEFSQTCVYFYHIYLFFS